MKLEIVKTKQRSRSAYKIDPTIEKFASKNRSCSTSKDLELKEFTKDEEANLQEITDLFEKQIKVFENTKSEFFLTCPICMLSFNEQQNCPKVLTCGHTLCLQCLIQQFEKKQCPICRRNIYEYYIERQIQMIEEKVYENFVIQCQEHPEQEIIFYEQKLKKLLCKKCIFYQKRSTCSLKIGSLITSQELYHKLFRFWKLQARKIIKCKSIIQYSKCDIQRQLTIIKESSIEKVEEKARLLTQQINEIKENRIKLINNQSRLYQEEYQMYKFKNRLSENFALKSICNMECPIDSLWSKSDIQLFHNYCQLSRLSLMDDVKTGSYSYNEFRSKIEEIGDIANKQFELNQDQPQ